MVLASLKEQTQRGHGRAPNIGFRMTIGFRMSYYAICVLIAGALVGVLYVGSLLE